MYPAGAARLTLVKQIRLGVRQRSPAWDTRPACIFDACLDVLWQQRTPSSFKTTMLNLAVKL